MSASAVNSLSGLRLRTKIFGVLLVAVLGLGFIKVARTALAYYGIYKGTQLNREAWEANFLERKLALPAYGPRDGYWGARLTPSVKHPRVGWIFPAMHQPGMLDIDAGGMQHAGEMSSPVSRILVVGASTAFGGYASTMNTTYFAQLAQLLSRERLPVRVDVLATGAWKSQQEVEALELWGFAGKPDFVVFLNGLNDLTNGSNARTLFGVETPTRDGSRWHPLYNEQDYADRTALYQQNMQRGVALCRAAGAQVVFALQPALFEKEPRSELERRVEEGTLKALGRREELVSWYEVVRRGLSALARNPGVHFVDCSRIFNGDAATTFTDMWHFADPGHAKLAERLAEGVKPLILGRLGGAS